MKKQKKFSKDIESRALTASGITLIALVITIIVLLILAAVALRLVTGEEGILGRAKRAVAKSNETSSQEEADLAIADATMWFYEATPAEKEGATTAKEFVKKKLESEAGLATASGKLTLKEGKLTHTTSDGTVIAEGTYNAETGKATLTETKDANKKTENNSITAKITEANYGDYIDLGTTIFPQTNGKITNKLEGSGEAAEIKTDWRIFYKGKDSEGKDVVIAMLADYLPYSKNGELNTGLSTTSDYPYNWKSDSSRDDLMNRLKGTTGGGWSKLLTGSKVASATATGAVTLPTWIESWNSHSNYTKLYLGGNDSSGYTVGNTDPVPSNSYAYNVSSNEGYNDNLYFPHKTYTQSQNADSYWMASASANGASYVMDVRYDGNMRFDRHTDCDNGVRPVVALDASVRVTWDDGKKVWNVQ